MSGLQLRTNGPLASMTFAIGLANQINALAKRFGESRPLSYRDVVPWGHRCLNAPCP